MNACGPRAREDAPAPGGVRLSTRFGEFEADARNLIAFPAGLPGFESCRRFALLSSVEAAPLQCLHAVSGSPASFLALDPRLVVPGYRTAIADADRDRLGLLDGQDAPLLWLALLTFDGQGAAFANLKAPVVINPARMIGMQILPPDSACSLRHPVSLR
jgi:flagellar assembly factor FliW